MKYAIISDIHANLEALEAVRQEIEEVTKTALGAPFPSDEQFDRYVYA